MMPMAMRRKPQHLEKLENPAALHARKKSYQRSSNQSSQLRETEDEESKSPARSRADQAGWLT
jgi:hypothetical protein